MNTPEQPFEEGPQARSPWRSTKVFVRKRGAFVSARTRTVPLRALMPNLVTLLALCAGLTAIRMAIDGRFEIAVGAIIVAAVLDGLDGRLARLLKVTSRFGAELDSLADFVNFGVAPAVIIYTWAFKSIPSLGWVVALIFALCAALRLARFNAELDRPVPGWQANFFAGVPAPAGALVVLLPFYVEGLGLPHVPAMALAVLIHTLVIGVLMVSRYPTYSGKALGQRVEREYVVPLFVIAIALTAMLLTYPYLSLTVGAIAYLASIPLAGKRFREYAEGTGNGPDATEKEAKH